jgi:hypothetical protein
MRVFVSFASSDRAVAEEVALRLRGDDHEVFLDRTAMPAGSEYDEVIREELDRSDLMVFLISPASVEKGRYTLTELRLFEMEHPHPAGYLLPVLIAPTPKADIPAYVRAVSYLEPMGNTAAEVAAVVETYVKKRRKRLAIVIGGIVGAVALAATGTIFALSGGGGSPAAPSTSDAHVELLATDAPVDAAVDARPRRPAIDAALPSIDAAPPAIDAGITMRVSTICYTRTGTTTKIIGSCEAARCPKGCTESTTTGIRTTSPTIRIDRKCTRQCKCPIGVLVCGTTDR